MSMESDVKAFQVATGQFDTHIPHHNFYHKLIEEEFIEHREAANDNDEVEEFDACLDMIYVILGHMIQRGWDIQGGWDEVQRSNMAKVDPETGRVRRRLDGKILKPEGWNPPNLTPFIRKENKV